MDTTIYEDEQVYQVRQLAELTRKGKINWTCIEYAPLSFMTGNDLGKAAPYFVQMFTLGTERNGDRLELQLSESIDLRSGKGDIAISLERDGAGGFTKYDDALSFDNERYTNCAAGDLGEAFKDHIAVLFASAVPEALKSEAVSETYDWARFTCESGIRTEWREHALFKLCEKLFNERNLLGFHHCVLDLEYRKTLLDEQDK